MSKSLNSTTDNRSLPVTGANTDVFADPVGFLARFGIDAVLIEPIAETALPVAA
jgi:hypothetical protein